MTALLASSTTITFSPIRELGAKIQTELFKLQESLASILGPPCPSYFSLFQTWSRKETLELFWNSETCLIQCEVRNSRTECEMNQSWCKNGIFRRNYCNLDNSVFFLQEAENVDRLWISRRLNETNQIDVHFQRSREEITSVRSYILHISRIGMLVSKKTVFF